MSSSDARPYVGSYLGSPINVNTADGEHWARMYSACLAREQALIAERDRLREAITTHRRNVWGKYGEVNHPEDVELYAALAEGGQDE